MDFRRLGLCRNCPVVFLLVSIFFLPLSVLVSRQLSNTSSLRNSVESQGRTLEELEWVYNQPNPVKASLHVDKVLVRGDGVVTEKVIDA